ncbi:poliovirus receptor homolog [Sorex fumeus]|uniref:poliovirus receptor homolog n=1 Tax=Sorex fumeus TaxID=62283 RepID=UPI0024ADC162|nr:poliovirus receptor homolog [Sorex fumeus]
MARTPPLWMLLPLLWASTGAWTEKVSVRAPAEVYSFLSYTAKLPCSLRPLEPNTTEVTQITWLRQEPSGKRRIVAAFHPLRGPHVSEPDRDRMEFAAARQGANPLDGSLTIHRMRPEDEANYTCEITTFPWGTGSASTWLRLFYAPQVSISRSDVPGQQGRKETILTCDVRSNPEPKGYEWSTTTGPLPSSAVPQGSRLLIQPTEESINTTFICRVSNAVGTGQAARRVLLPAPTAKEVVAVWAPGEVHGFLGDTVKLPCNLRFPESKPQNVTQITWKRILESGHVMFTAAEWGHNLLDASLSVHRLHPEDDANYTCEITTLQEGSYSATTWLRVFYAPQVFISRSDTTGQQGRYETTLTCNARGNPEPKSYDWNTTMGSLPPSAVPQGSRLLIQHTEESINATFICHVSNDLGTGQAAMRVEFPAVQQLH